MSPEVSSAPVVPPPSPPPDRIEQLFQELGAKIREYRPRDDLASVEKAFRIASELHKGQLRQSGEPYMVHPLMVAHILAGMRMDLVTIETGLLHDLVEDTRMTPDEIRKGFGDEVARCVDGVTKLSKLDIFNAEERQAESFRKMLL
ncbi:MAG: HD domain-containing protein, partial [Bryobacteraceae bacterium]